MGLGDFFQKSAMNLVFANKEKLFALAIEKLEKEYAQNRMTIARKIVAKLPPSWHDTATPEETAALVDLIKDFVEKLYYAVQAMKTKPEPGATKPRPTQI